MDEVLLIDKPKDWTSFDVVAKIRTTARIVTNNRKIKVGHAGTLDPFATGLLIVLLGARTKQQDTFMKQDKVYSVVAKLGWSSTTGDPEGELTQTSSHTPTEQMVQEVLQKQLGTIQQVPPIYSAIKINGKRAYDLARSGKEVTMSARTVTIYSITDVKYEYPLLYFRTKVSSGTYIRSLVSDIGLSLGTGAYTTELRRDAIGEHRLEDALSVEDAIRYLEGRE